MFKIPPTFALIPKELDPPGGPKFTLDLNIPKFRIHIEMYRNTVGLALIDMDGLVITTAPDMEPVVTAAVHVAQQFTMMINNQQTAQALIDALNQKFSAFLPFVGCIVEHRK